MGPAFAAVGAGIAALLQATIASRYQIAGAPLQISLVLAVAVTLVNGFEEGMAWAFVGGLCLDFFTMRPLGSSVFELLIAVALTTIAEPLLSRSRYPGCVLAVLVLTPIFLDLGCNDRALAAARTAAPIQPSHHRGRGEWDCDGRPRPARDRTQEALRAEGTRSLVEVTE